jgi:hypothetical protein
MPLAHHLDVTVLALAIQSSTLADGHRAVLLAVLERVLQVLGAGDQVTSERRMPSTVSSSSCRGTRRWSGSKLSSCSIIPTRRTRSSANWSRSTARR